VVNQPDTDKCTRCGLNAVASAGEFMAADPSRDYYRSRTASTITGNLLLFFPEIMVAAVIVALAPG
jgi:hypothetical protein